MEKFREALKHSDTVKAVLTGVGQTIFLSEEVSKYIDELERLARIGRATEKAFERQEYCIASYKGNHLRAIKTIEELLALKESED